MAGRIGRVRCRFPCLPRYMREGWEAGRFWLSYGARKGWMFGMVYCNF